MLCGRLGVAPETISVWGEPRVRAALEAGHGNGCADIGGHLKGSCSPLKRPARVLERPRQEAFDLAHDALGVVVPRQVPGSGDADDTKVRIPPEFLRCSVRTVTS